MDYVPFTAKYTPNPLTDHNTTPTDASVTQINNAFAAAEISSARYNIDFLIDGTPTMPALVENMLHAANDAINFGDVDQETMENAVQFAEKAKTARGPDMTLGLLSACKPEIFLCQIVICFLGLISRDLYLAPLARLFKQPEIF